ncbi:unnamed protein product [Prorocentrum cordatum]|nr:unnamed protein product [Polarella glacialis]
MPMFPRGKPEREWAVVALEVERDFVEQFSNFLFRPTDPVAQSKSRTVDVVLGYLEQQLGRTVTGDLQNIEDAPWLLDYPHPTLVDLSLAPHVERAVAWGLYYKGYDIRNSFPNINAWLTALEKLPYYMATRGDFYTHCLSIASPQNAPVPDADALPKRVRALLSPASSRLPVQRSAEPEPWSASELQSPESVHSAEAAVELLRGHAAVARFCCRADGDGVGRWAAGGLFRAQLADPLAEPREGGRNATRDIRGDDDDADPPLRTSCAAACAAPPRRRG